MRWVWSVAAIVPATPGVTNGTAATLDEAKARFREAWERSKLMAGSPKL
jgi:predicted RNase H-like HicB family nuclease